MSAKVFNPQQLTWIKEQVKIAVVCGSEKSCAENYIYENLSPRSTKTYRRVAEDIAETLEEVGFKHVSLLEENIYLPQQLKENRIDVVFSNSGGLQGYDSMCHLPSMLEMLGVPYIGHAPMTAGLLDNKLLFKNELSALGIPTAPFITLEPGELLEKGAHQRALDYIDSEFGEGYIVKPISGRASIHVYTVFDRTELQAVVDNIHQATNNSVLIEPYLSGPEFVAAVAGSVLYRDGGLSDIEAPFVFSVTERVLSDDELIFTSMDQRPITKDRLKTVTDEELRADIVAIARQIFQSFNLHTLIRVDLRMDGKGRLFVLEANPKPDLKLPKGSEINLVAFGLDREEMSYQELIQSLVFNRLQYLYQERPATVTHCLNADFALLSVKGECE
ncbi:D-alanine--D-alanine ligase B [Grimontia celer]|uniref:D-alanine--D-alanine ligase B n=1 Tax=Grimontia celer TaxID=1796497 RepID=A0A128EWB0_9GAMM|nr:ATP-grasp domain-containing protein [Grimontia celer]CZF78281.1 D-alanine--D-alanine ligase B [Grimontia celer]